MDTVFVLMRAKSGDDEGDASLETVIGILQAKLKENEGHAFLERALSHLMRLEYDDLITWDVINEDFKGLAAQGIWEESPQNDALLERIREMLITSAGDDSTDFEDVLDGQIPILESGVASVIVPLESILPSILPPRFVPPDSSFIKTLTKESITAVHGAYRMHLIATDPTKVPLFYNPLLSAMLGAHAPQPNGEQQLATDSLDFLQAIDQEDSRAKALKELSSPDPLVQLSRLKQLYEDIHEALIDRLENDHPVLVTFSSPPSSTSSLRLAASHLRQAVMALSDHCTPVRKALASSLVEKLASVSSDASTADLAPVVFDSTQSILKLRNLMTQDALELEANSVGRRQMRGQVIATVGMKEHDFILDMWSASEIQTFWKIWMEELQPEALLGSDSPYCAWRARFIQAVGSSKKLACPLPRVQEGVSKHPTEPNPQHQPTLPHVVLFTWPAIANIQKNLESLIIAASLRTLVRLPSALDLPDSSPSFMERVWALLNTSFDAKEESVKTTSLIEIIRASRRAQPAASQPVSASEDEEAIDHTVKRMLTMDGPVFQLLSNRLLRAFSRRLQSSLDSQLSTVPAHMQTGREHPTDGVL